MYIVFLVTLNDCYFKTDEKAKRSQIMKSKKGIVSIAVGNVLIPFFQVIFAFLK